MVMAMDANGKKYEIVGTYGKRKAKVLATEGKCLIDGKKVRIVFNVPYKLSTLGLTSVDWKNEVA